MEILVIDDASVDTTPSVVKGFTDVRYLALDTRSGPSVARNAGIAQSQGKYLAFLDDDDVWMHNRLKLQVPILELQPEVGVVYGYGLVKREDGKMAIWPEFGPSGWVFEDFLTRTEDFINIDTLLVRRELLARAGPFDETLETMEHYDFALRLARCCQWYFLKHPVAYGRYLKEGKYHSDIMNGAIERCLPVIVERASRLLPDAPNGEPIRRRARAAICATIANLRWKQAGAESVKSYLLSELRAHPWLINELTFQESIKSAVWWLAVSSSDARTAVLALWSDLRSALRTHHMHQPLEWSDVVAEAVQALRIDKDAPLKAACLALPELRNPGSWSWRLAIVTLKALVACALRRLRSLLHTCDIVHSQKRWATIVQYLAKSSDVYFVEIGAMDGIQHDPLYDPIQKYGWRGLLIEPLPDLFAELQDTYRGKEGIHMENVAVADEPGTKTLFRVDPKAVRTGKVPDWAKGISSFYQDRNAIGGQGISRAEFDCIRPHVLEENVPCDTLANILRRHGVIKIDVLQIDVEGYDYHILKQLDFEQFRPKVIRIEWCNLPASEKQLALQLLRKWKYRTVEVGLDLLAWQRH
jgi:FkbM family methyltransferase